MPSPHVHHQGISFPDTVHSTASGNSHIKKINNSKEDYKKCLILYTAYTKLHKGSGNHLEYAPSPKSSSFMALLKPDCKGNICLLNKGE